MKITVISWSFNEIYVGKRVQLLWLKSRLFRHIVRKVTFISLLLTKFMIHVQSFDYIFDCFANLYLNLRLFCYLLTIFVVVLRFFNKISNFFRIFNETYSCLMIFWRYLWLFFHLQTKCEFILQSLSILRSFPIFWRNSLFVAIFWWNSRFLTIF